MTLPILWFILIAVLWIGYLTLEGFDFGVGMLLKILGRDERERRAMLGTIGPHWDGNEVWLLTAGGATFAAFPEWYGTLFSGATSCSSPSCCVSSCECAPSSGERRSTTSPGATGGTGCTRSPPGSPRFCGEPPSPIWCRE